MCRPSPLYSFSFQQKHDWTRFFASQPEILEYINDTAVKQGIKSRIRLSTDVEACEWIEETKRWRVHLRRRRVDKPWALDEPTTEEDQLLQEGDRWVHECKVIVSCVGALVHPKECEIPGYENFKGDLFHSARWNHGVDLTGKDVIVVGNGCKILISVNRTKFETFADIRRDRFCGTGCSTDNTNHQIHNTIHTIRTMDSPTPSTSFLWE